MGPSEFTSFQRRVRWLDWFFRWGGAELPDTPIGHKLLCELIRAYDHADEDGRRRLRALMEKRAAFATNVPLRGAAAASSATFRDHLIWFALIFDSGDPRDSVLWLHDLCQTGRQAGLAIEPVLREVAAMAGGDREDGWRSAKGQLLDQAGRVARD